MRHDYTKIRYNDIRSFIYDKYAISKLNANIISIFSIDNIIGKDEFVKILKDFNVNYSNGGNSDIIPIQKNYLEFVSNDLDDGNQNYVFHNVLKDVAMLQVINTYLPPIQCGKQLRISRLYTGSKGSGTNIHNHSVAVNYLISGKKLWIVFPDNKHNTDFLIRNRCTYGNISKSTKEWFSEYRYKLGREIIDFELLTQVSGEIIIIPNNYYHAVINLSEVFGITYSWF